MTIALARADRLSAARYALIGELSRNASWVQTLELPADAASVSISGQTVKITFRVPQDDTVTALSISTTDSQITIVDADTLTIAATPADMSALLNDYYYVDLASEDGSNVVTLWATGVVFIRESPIAF